MEKALKYMAERKKYDTMLAENQIDKPAYDHFMRLLADAFGIKSGAPASE